MKKLNPIIKFNGGSPIALCNRCFVIMCYVTCTEIDGKYCKVLRVNGYGNELHISSNMVGKEPPIYCDKCKALLSYTLNE